MRIRPILYEKEVKPKKLVSNPVKVSFRCTDVIKQEGSLFLIQISRKANNLFVSFSLVNFMLGCRELRKSKKDMAPCSVLKR